jgi:hypothetical protein
MLNHCVTHERLHNVIVGWDKTRATWSMSINGHVRLGLQRVDVVDGVLLASRYVYASSIVRSEAGLL